MTFRLAAPNWERPSHDYCSHIIMSISGIYLLISILTLYHSQVLSLIQVHEITYFHHTLCLVKYTSALFGSLAPTDYFPPASPYAPYHGLWSADNCTQRPRSRISPACSTSSAGGSARRISAHVQQPSLLNIDLHSTVREQQVQTSNTISTDKYDPVRSIHQTHAKHLKCYTTPPPPAQTCSKQGAI